MWELNQAHLGVTGLGNNELVRGDTFTPPAPRPPGVPNPQHAGKNLPELVLIRYLATGTVDPQGALSIRCIITGTESAVISDELRKYLENDLREAIAAEVKQALGKFLADLKDQNEAQQEQAVNKLLVELPRNPDLVQALKKALKP